MDTQLASWLKLMAMGPSEESSRESITDQVLLTRRED